MFLFHLLNSLLGGVILNYKLFKVAGKHIETKRVRTLKINAIDEEDAIELAKNSGLETIESIEVIPFEPPTERQIEYATDLGITIPDDACKWDVSTLIDRVVERDGTPREELIEFATNRRLFFSKYIGKSALYNLIFRELPDLDRVAFFVFCVYRHISDDRHANLDTHPYRDRFYEFAENHVKDERFMKSMNRYSGGQLKFFGELTINGWIHTGGSVNTIAFKAARQFLIDNDLIKAAAHYAFKSLDSDSTNDTETTTNVEIVERKRYEIPKYELPAVVLILVLLVLYIFLK